MTNIAANVVLDAYELNRRPVKIIIFYNYNHVYELITWVHICF